MSNHFKLLREGLEWSAWYTIGDSIVGGTYIPTHIILSKIISKLGFYIKLSEIDRRMMRGRKLYLLKIFNMKIY